MRFHDRHQPNHRAWVARAGLTAASATGGALAAHLLDPDRGRARRVQWRDQSLGICRRGARRARRRAVFTSRFLVGRLERARHALVHDQRHVHLDDNTLIQKIRSEVLGPNDFGRWPISIDSCDGVVHLRGEVTSAEASAAVVRAVEHVPGVTRVESFLHLPGQVAPNKHAALRATSG